MGGVAEPGLDDPGVLPEDHSVRGEDLHRPAVRPPLLPQVAYGVAGLPGEPEPNGQVAAPRPSGVALEAERSRYREVPGEPGMQSQAPREPPGILKGGGGVPA